MRDIIPPDLDPIRPEGRMGDRFDSAVEDLRSGARLEEIRKVVLDDAKSILGRSVDKAWDRHVQEPFFFRGKYADQPEEIQALYRAITVSSLHDCISARKKVDRSGLSGPVIDAMNLVLDRALPLAETTKSLKDFVVKGRLPNPDPAPVNPDKETGTCSCCFRGIAVTGHGKMAHHGFQRPGTGTQTASCAGVDFPPLEKSMQGLDWLVGIMREQLEKSKVRLSRKDSIREIKWVDRSHRGPGTALKTCSIDDPDWSRVHRRYFSALESEIRHAGKQLETIESEHEKWSEFHEKSTDNGIDRDDGPAPD